jgi:hypothetical protein
MYAIKSGYAITIAPNNKERIQNTGIRIKVKID